VNVELEEEKEAVRRLFESSSMRRLREAGIVLTGLVAAPEGQLYGDMVWRFRLRRPRRGAASAGLADAKARQGSWLLLGLRRRNLTALLCRGATAAAVPWHRGRHPLRWPDTRTMRRALLGTLAFIRVLGFGFRV
jgi:hypothetical protein